jgi:hypothetical protein
MLGMEPRALYTLSKLFNLHNPQPTQHFFFFKKGICLPEDKTP